MLKASSPQALFLKTSLPKAAVRKERSVARSTIPAPPSAAPDAIPTVSAISSGSSQSLPIRFFEDGPAWEAWLEANLDDTAGAWLKISKKGATIASVTYDQAVDAALCFGWIDGQRKSHDAEHFLQRFTPRRRGSVWSKRNVEKVAVLTVAGRVRTPGQAEIDAAKADGRWERAYAGSGAIEVPKDFGAALAGNQRASKFFEALGKTQRYSFLWRIETAKRPETRKRKIAQFVELLAEHKTL